MSNLHLLLSPPAGIHIREAAERLLAARAADPRIGGLVFNETVVYADGCATAAEVVAEYHRKRNPAKDEPDLYSVTVPAGTLGKPEDATYQVHLASCDGCGLPHVKTLPLFGKAPDDGWVTYGSRGLRQVWHYCLGCKPVGPDAVLPSQE